MKFKNYLYRLARKFRKIYNCKKNKKKYIEEYSQFIKKPRECFEKNKGIVIIVHEANWGGAPVLGMNMAKEYIKMGYDVHIISLGYGPMISSFSGITTTQVCLNKQEFVNAIKLLKVKGYSIVICNGIATGLYVQNLQQEGFKIISLIHELPGVIRYLQVEKVLFKMGICSHKMVFPASYVKNTLEKEFGKIHSKVDICHQGLFSIPTKQYNKIDIRKKLAIQYGFDETKKLFINVATANERKGFDLFVKMACQDKQNCYLWVGDGLESTFVNTIICEIGKFPSNLILPGYINNKELMTQIYAAASLLLLTSREEPFGSVVLEAFANKTPVIAFDNCGGYVDVVIPNVTGDLAKPFDIDDMLEKAKCLCDSDVYDNIGMNCFNVALNSKFETYCLNILKDI